MADPIRNAGVTSDDAAPVDALTPDQARAEIRSLTADLAATTMDGRRPAKEARRLALYQRAYGTAEVVHDTPAPAEYDPEGYELNPLTADSVIATESPEATRARIATITSELRHYNEGTAEYRMALLDREAAFKKLYPPPPESASPRLAGEPETPPPVEPAPPAEPATPAYEMPPLVGETTWDTAAWNGFYAALPTPAAQHALVAVQGAIAGAILNGRAYTEEENLAALAALVGADQVEATMDAAERALAHPALTEAYFAQFTAHPVKLTHHPRVILALAALSRRLA